MSSFFEPSVAGQQNLASSGASRDLLTSFPQACFLPDYPITIAIFQNAVKQFIDVDKKSLLVSGLSENYKLSIGFRWSQRYGDINDVKKIDT